MTQPPDRRRIEREMAALTKLLGDREFDSIEDANAAIQALLSDGKLPPVVPETPLDRAQELVYQAVEATGAQRLKLARQAIEVSPDCADAYVLIAEMSPTAEAARPLYEQAVAAAERALGPEIFKEAAGHFWGIIETRPYMRARAGLAQVLWTIGERASAIDHAEDLLRLNPNDNQGIRDMLTVWLFATNDLKGAQALLNRYKDDWSAISRYSKVLLNLRQRGNKNTARKLIREAAETNPWVPVLLVGAKPLPKALPSMYAPGSEDEAVLYMADHAMLWFQTDGAVETLMREYVLLGAKAMVERDELRRDSKLRWTL